MKEIRGNIFMVRDADAICTTTNGVVKANGDLVMGAGNAKAFAERFPGLASDAGELVTAYGNICQVISIVPHPHQENYDLAIIAFPTKHHFKDSSDPQLIVKSARELVAIVDSEGFSWKEDPNGDLVHTPWKKIVLPRPGCALGNLNWVDVKPLIEPILDDRFYVITL